MWGLLKELPIKYYLTKDGKMEKLTKKEELIMEVLWKLKKAFVKEVLNELKGEKLHYNTVSTIIRNLEEKKFLSHEAFGNTHQYFPLLTKEEYGKELMTLTSVKFFNNSYKNMFSYFAKEEKISVEELKEIIEIIEKEN